MKLKHIKKWGNPEYEKRNHQLSVLLTETEWNALVDYAVQNGLSKNEAARVIMKPIIGERKSLL